MNKFFLLAVTTALVAPVPSFAVDVPSTADSARIQEMLSFIFQSLKLNEKKLEYTMRYPFGLFADANKTGEWCG